VRSVVTRLRGVDVTVCATDPVDGSSPGVRSVVSAYADAGVRVVGVRGWRGLRAFVARSSFDVLHAHKYRQNAMAAVVGRLCGVPVVVCHEHTWHYGYWPERILVDRLVIGRLASAFVAVSAEDARRMVAVEGVRASVVRHIPNGIPPLPAPTHPPPWGHAVVGAVAHLREQKRLDLLLRAAAGLDVRVVLVGEGPQEPALRALAASLGVDVVFAGRRTDIADVLAAIDVFVCCSDYEGAPLAVIEAMQAGKPIVATAVGGVPELLGDAGVLVPPGDVAALRAAIRARIADPGGYGAAAAERARAFDVDVTVRAIEALYAELLSRA
jgi:glycosyltransferase involved in cell wall biosynthesis